MVDYSIIDVLPVLRYVFYPRHEHAECPEDAFDISVPVEDGVFISCMFYIGISIYPWILFFHGNGETVSDYDHISSYYKKIALILLLPITEAMVQVPEHHH